MFRRSLFICILLGVGLIGAKSSDKILSNLGLRTLLSSSQQKKSVRPTRDIRLTGTNLFEIRDPFFSAPFNFPPEIVTDTSHLDLTQFEDKIFLVQKAGESSMAWGLEYLGRKNLKGESTFLLGTHFSFTQNLNHSAQTFFYFETLLKRMSQLDQQSRLRWLVYLFPGVEINKWTLGVQLSFLGKLLERDENGFEFDVVPTISYEVSDQWHFRASFAVEHQFVHGSMPERYFGFNVRSVFSFGDGTTPSPRFY